jgi:amidohydrolase
MDLHAVKERVRAEVDARTAVLLDASHQIHEHPELNYEEQFAHDLLTGVLEGEGLAVERSAFGLDTAFVARAGSRGPTIAVLCEYDALPGIGHACGHNIIATAGLGAGLAAAAVAEEAGGQVVILGTPAEEGGGGKIRLIRAGALDGIDAALMVHPAGAELTRMQAIAVQEVTATYTGVAAHAAAFPHEGRNALDAAVLGYVNVATLRQHIRPHERIHGIVTAGGDKPNIVPAHARTEWMVRSGSIRTLAPLKERFEACLTAGARAAGCDVDIAWKDVVYADMLDNEVMVGLYAANARSTGREVLDPDSTQAVVGSTDMGNVSYVVPSIHPMIQAAPLGVPIHTPEFAEHARGAPGDQAVLDGALVLACTIADLWLVEGALDAARAEFAATMDRVGPDARRSAIGGSVRT